MRIALRMGNFNLTERIISSRSMITQIIFMAETTVSIGKSGRLKGQKLILINVPWPYPIFHPTGEEGYPGNLHVVVTFTVTKSNELKVSYQANTDKSTPINPTSHSYFNLSGFSERTIYDHELEINGKFFTEKNADNVPTGKLLLCEGTPLDFRQRKKIGTHIKELDFDRGYNHNFVIDNPEDGVRSAATLINKSDNLPAGCWKFLATGQAFRYILRIGGMDPLLGLMVSHMVSIQP